MTPAAKFMARPKREKRLLMKWKTLGKSIYLLLAFVMVKCVKRNKTSGKEII